MKLLFKCDDCSHTTTKNKLKDVGELDADYLYPGAIIPAGRCPKCDAGCFPLVLDLASRKTVKAIHMVWDALSDILETPTKHSPAQQRAGVRAIAQLRKIMPPELTKNR